MKRTHAILLLALSCLVGCSALQPQQRTVLSNQVANIEAFRLDYVAINCNACTDCEAMRSAVAQTAQAAGPFDAYRDTKEKQVRAYLERLRAALPSVPQSCSCAEDAALCPSAKIVLEQALGNADELEKYLAGEGVGKSFLGGIVGRAAG